MTEHQNSSADIEERRPIADVLQEFVNILEAVRGERDVIRVSGLVGNAQDVGVVSIDNLQDNLMRAIAELRSSPPAQAVPERGSPEWFCKWLSGYLGCITGQDELDAFEANSIRSELAWVVPPPAAPVVPPEVLERRRKGLPDYEKPPLGQPPSWLQEQEPIQRSSAVNASEPRFFIDHGMIHDRLTGKHVTTEPDSAFCDGIVKCCELLNSLVERREPRVFPLLFDGNWLENKIKSDPDVECEAGPGLTLNEPQTSQVTVEPANKPAVDPKKITAIDDFLADGQRDNGYRAFAMMRHIWPQLRELALASSQLSRPDRGGPHD